MHTNYRRKKAHGKSKKGEGRGWLMLPYSLVRYRHFFWHSYRAKTRHLLEHGRYDDFEDKILPSILWSYW